MELILQLRTKDNLNDIAEANTIGHYVISSKKLDSNSINTIEVYDWNGKTKMVADFVEGIPGKEEFADRIIVKFKNPRIEKTEFKWLGQNPVKYILKSNIDINADTKINNDRLKKDPIASFINKKIEHNGTFIEEESYYKNILPAVSPFLSWTENLNSNQLKALPSNLCPFTKIHSELLNELEEAKKDILLFYTSPLNLKNLEPTTNLTPKDILSILTTKKVRLSRIREVLNPQKTTITFTHKESNFSYLNVKAYWWDDNENRTRGINKAICKFENNSQKIDYSDLEKRIANLFKEDGFEIMKRSELDKLNEVKINHNADLLISKNNEVHFISTSKLIELIENDKKNDQISMYFLRLSMYNEYKKIYQEHKSNLIKSTFEKYLSIFGEVKKYYEHLPTLLENQRPR